MGKVDMYDYSKAPRSPNLNHKKLPTDTQLIDYLESKNGTYTGWCILRMSSNGRGFRLHETSLPDAKPTVREAISDAIKRDKNA